MTNYTVGQWHQFENFECSLCPFATLDEELMQLHQRAIHAKFPDAPSPDKERPETELEKGHIDHPSLVDNEAQPAITIKETSN